MYKHSPSRNQRSKGIKVKHVLQICLLVAVCFWLIYQVKRSHDNKRKFDDSAKKSLATEQNDGVVKLGRKDLNPRMEGKGIQTGKQDEEDEDEETAVEEEENKHEEVEEEDDNKTDEKEKEEEEEDVDEGRGGGEEIDDNDQEKSDTDNDQEVDFVDDEKERENVDELKLEDKDAEDNKGQTENVTVSASREQYKKGGITITRDAQKENDNADDASSAVTHDTQIITTDNQTRIIGKSNQQGEVREFEHQNQSIIPETGAGKCPPVKVEGGIANSGSYLSVTTIGQSETAIATSNGTEGNKNSHNSTAMRIEPQKPPLPLWNMTFSEHYEDEDVVEDHKNERNGSKFQIIDNKLGGNSTLPGSNYLHDFTATINTDSKDMDPSLKESEKSDGTWSSISKNWSNNSANVSAKTEEAFDDTKDNREDGTNETLDELNFETSDELQVDPIDSSDTTNYLEEKLLSNDL